MRNSGRIGVLLLWFLLGCVASASRVQFPAEESSTTNPERYEEQQFARTRRLEGLSEQSIRSQWDAYKALQAWKQLITRDPLNITSTWCGEDVCNYKGVFCSAAPDNACERVVTGIDLNHGFLTGQLPEELGLLSYLVLFHINTNFFWGQIPDSIRKLTHLFELDLSNNRFAGFFPNVTLELPSLRYLDVRFNYFRGQVPPKLFQIGLDAIFINNNGFQCNTPDVFSNSQASVMVLANNMIQGEIPSSIGSLNGSVEEILLLGNKLTGCIPESVGNLTAVKVLDLGGNDLGGYIPESIAKMKALEQLNLADNLLSGPLPPGLCDLPKLQNLTISGNFITAIQHQCLQVKTFDDSENCLPYEANQRPEEQCVDFLAMPTSCFPAPLSPPSPPVMPPPPPPPPPPPSPPPPPPAYVYKSPPPFH